MSDERPEVELKSTEQLREWLQANHDSSAGIWLVHWKKDSGGPYIPWGEIVREFLAFGWIDSKTQRVDEGRTRTTIGPRNPSSAWSRINKEHIEALLAEGRMAPAGLTMVEHAKESGTWTALDQVEALEEPDDLAAALDADGRARSNWDAFPPSARRAILAWIESAKRPGTRAKRIGETTAKAARNERANEYQPRSERL